jgi:hypothetical protein
MLCRVRNQQETEIEQKLTHYVTTSKISSSIQNRLDTHVMHQLTLPVPYCTRLVTTRLGA